jgi:hypothetical protein
MAYPKGRGGFESRWLHDGRVAQGQSIDKSSR